jgi:hypothetical protein
MNVIALNTRCLWVNISNPTTWFSQTKATTTVSHYEETTHGPREVIVQGDVTFLFAADGMCSVCCPRSSPLSIIQLLFRYSILPALSLDGVIHLEVLDHAFTGHEFANFVKGVLDQMQPWPLPNSVLVMDNARIHHVPGIREMIEERYIFSLVLNVFFSNMLFFQWDAVIISSSLLA